ncbi:hypothetical protein GSI_02277 [Ganoderma sinense ZZ0214-1]|uniref:DUF6534 domain-containing protein n=1 Tax=Ganoderma sinense ZZ0214-1 TaxID=1077348 RepID=A0A2G8SP64_9APHY|nr:hypothetical protein GSI_02277 [Ganoderma sinense ZZ0214-1]
MRFPRDAPEVKIWVMLVWALDSSNVVLVCHGLYYWAWSLVSGNLTDENNTQREAFSKRSFCASAVLNLVVAAVVQCFFIKRIYKHTSHKIPAANDHGRRVEIPFEYAANMTSSLDSLASLKPSDTLPYMILAVASDLFLAGTLTSMSRGRSPQWNVYVQQALLRLRSMFHQVITLLINRCILISGAAIARLVIFMILPWTAWFMVADFIMGKLYANSFMACLNARSLFPERGASQFDTAMFSSVPDVSVQSNGSVLPSSFAPTPHNGTHRPVSRPASLPDLVFCKNGHKGGITATTSLAPGGVWIQ